MLSHRNIFCAALLIICAAGVYAQSPLYMPLNFQDAYESQTRSYDGLPGPNYWQNKSDYSINAKLDPQTRKLSGTENIIYYNNSPDTLDQLVIRLYQNFNKLGNTHDFPLDESEPSAGMPVTLLLIDGDTVDLKDKTEAELTGTNLIIKDMDIVPGGDVSISASWNFVIPKKNAVRMGAYDSTTFFIGYWYPQVAVYDDIDGWDLTQYTGIVEFYNDFNNYDVNITVPSNICIWATGNLVNPGQVYSESVLERYNEAKESEDKVEIISKDDYADNAPILRNSSDSNVWHFTANNISDFAFGTGAHYVWDGQTVNTGAGKTFVSAVYPPDSAGFDQVCGYAAQSVEILSKQLPGVPFPFGKMTIFSSSEGGMEYPAMVNEDFSGPAVFTVNTTAHEIIHSYFPFYMGINERKYAWMDEGWAQMLSEYVQYAIDSSFDSRAKDIADYLSLAGQDKETPLMILSYNERETAYTTAAYVRSAAAYNTLKELLGDELFKKALQEYIRRWNGKHPTPYDFFFTFNDAAKEDLSWFWQPWFFDQGYPDLGIDSVNINDDKALVGISLEGKIPVSVSLTFKFSDGSERTVFKNCSVWKDAEEAWFELPLEGRKLKSIELGNPHIPDVNKENNLWEAP